MNGSNILPAKSVASRIGRGISLGLILFAGMIFVLLFSFTDKESTLDARIFSLLEFTLFQALLSTLLSIMIGLLLAWSLAHQKRFFGREWLIALFSSSLVLPSLVVVFGLISIYGRHGWINTLFEQMFSGGFGNYLYGLFGILLAHVYLNASYALRSLLQAFESIPLEKYKLAKSLGFGVMKRFWYVEFPALKSTMMGLASTIFLLCFSSFAIVLVLGGSPAYNTLEVAIYEAVRLEYDLSLALKLALIQLGISALFVWLSAQISTPSQNISSQHRMLKESAKISYLQGAVIGLFALFFISPLVAIMIDGLRADIFKIVQDPLFVRAFWTSIFIATISAFLTLVFAFFLGIAKRESRGAWSIMIGLSSNLYLAIPSLVMGVGFFLIYQRVGGSQELWAAVGLILANVLMSLPFALAILSPIMIKVATRYDKLCTSLGLRGYKRYKEVELAYLLPSLAYVFALSFCFSLGDLGMIALFGSDTFTTLPWYLYGLLGSYQSEDAAGVALLMMGLVLFVFLVFPWIFRRGDVRA